MRKEVIFAIIAGALLGLVVAFGVYRANVALKPGNSNQTKPTPEPVNNVELSIVKPDNLSVVTTPKITIEGITTSGAIVAISAETKDYVATTSATGPFSFDIALDGGLNEIKVFSFDKDEIKEKDLLIIYSSEFAKFLSTTTPETSTPSANETASDSVRQKVNEKIEMIEKSPAAYIGTITDKTDTNIQIKDQTGEIEQIAIDKDQTDFVKVIDSPKEITSTDLAIGDFIIAMGFKDGNKILDGKRIIVTTAFKSSARTAKLGTLTKGTPNTLKDKDNSYTLKFGASWDGPEISELTTTNKYLVIGSLQDSTLTVSLIKKI